MAHTQDDCIFCKIVAGEVPSTVVDQSDQVLAFEDIDPKAPVHVLVIPRDHIQSLADLDSSQSSLASNLLDMCNRVARAKGIADSGYRVMTSIGRDGGQEVPHLHFHVVGGRPLTFSV